VTDEKKADPQQYTGNQNSWFEDKTPINALWYNAKQTRKMAQMLVTPGAHVSAILLTS
jgi:hypothetical protein